MTAADQLYARLPVAAQHIAIASFGVQWRHRRLGGNFRRYCRDFARLEALDVDGWRSWQTGRLAVILQAAWSAPAYRAAWTEAGFSGRDVRALAPDRLAELPFLTKEAVRRDPRALLSGGRHRGRVRRFATSGSTGTPLVTLHSDDDLRRAAALREARYRSFAGVGWRLPRATLTGHRVEPDLAAQRPLYRYNLAERQTVLSSFHLRDESMAAYRLALWRHRPQWIHGYASAVHELCRLALERDIVFPPLRAAITFGEPPPHGLRLDVRRAFGCRLTQEYGSVEEVAFALECDQGSLHADPAAGVVEILDPDGLPCAPGEIGEVVATGLLREAQPFVRYRTGDLAAWAAEPCGCGRAMPVLLRIEGRVEDRVVTPDGRRLTRLTSIFRDLEHVLAGQIVQEEVARITVRVRSDRPLADATARELRRRLEQRLGDGMQIDVVRVDQLERTARGKVRTVVSRLETGSSEPRHEPTAGAGQT